jgi:hypothetical protein
MATRVRGDEKQAVEVAGRIGMAARGVTYIVVGLLAALVAFGHRSAPPSREGALEAVVQQPLGRGLVLLLVVGFAGFGAWQIAESVRTDEWIKRLAHAGRAALYAVFLRTALRYAFHGKSQRPGNGRREVDVTARILQWPGGRWIVLAIGAAIVAGGIWNGYRGLSQRYRKRLKWREMPPLMERVVPVIGTTGLVGRMVAFTLVGGFVMRAGWRHKPNDARGLDGALYELVHKSYGPALVLLVALGIVLYGAYSLIEARYRRIP